MCQCGFEVYCIAWCICMQSFWLHYRMKTTIFSRTQSWLNTSSKFPRNTFCWILSSKLAPQEHICHKLSSKLLTRKQFCHAILKEHINICKMLSSNLKFPRNTFTKCCLANSCPKNQICHAVLKAHVCSIQQIPYPRNKVAGGLQQIPQEHICQIHAVQQPPDQRKQLSWRDNICWMLSSKSPYQRNTCFSGSSPSLGKFISGKK